MSTVVALGSDTLAWPQGGGYIWLWLNWALGLRSHGCEVIWLEGVDPNTPDDEVRPLVGALKGKLAEYGLADNLALYSRTGEPLSPETLDGCLDIDAAAEADILLNMSYDALANVLDRFRRTAMLDFDPGLTQVWASEGVMPLRRHDVYFTIGETVGQPGTRLPKGEIAWQYTPQCVALDYWPESPTEEGAPFTTVSNWFGREHVTYGDEVYSNCKREGFVPYFDLPSHTDQPLELALCLEADEHLRLAPYAEEERLALEKRGWRYVHSYAVASTPSDYRRYVQGSRGEFSCAKPSGPRLQNAWISDRTLCYLASGKPAVIEHTGPSRILPERAGVFRFRSLKEASECLETVAADYERQGRLARALAEEHFDAGKVTQHVLERALD
jgi:hypothetical protein